MDSEYTNFHFLHPTLLKISLFTVQSNPGKQILLLSILAKMIENGLGGPQGSL